MVKSKETTSETTTCHEMQKENYWIKVEESVDMADIKVTDKSNGSRFTTSVSRNTLDWIYVDAIKENDFVIGYKDNGTIGITVKVRSITSTVDLKIEYSPSEESKDIWAIINNQSLKIRQLEQKKPTTKRISTPLLTKIQISSPVTHQIPIQVPKSTFALILRCECFFGNRNGHAYLEFEAQQQENNNGMLKVNKFHHNWYYNNTLEEFVIPWNGDSQNQTLEVRILSGLTNGTNDTNAYNYYTLSIEGSMEY